MKDLEPIIMDGAGAREIARQARVELEMLLCIEAALRSALPWIAEDRGSNRKLSTLRFHTGSFERHLTRVQALADHGGYLRVITDANPDFSAQVADLRAQCANLHDRLACIIVRLDDIAGDDDEALKGLCADLECLLDDLKTHGRTECALLQESFMREVGGSG